MSKLREGNFCLVRQRVWGKCISDNNLVQSGHPGRHLATVDETIIFYIDYIDECVCGVLRPISPPPRNFNGLVAYLIEFKLIAARNLSLFYGYVGVAF